MDYRNEKDVGDQGDNESRPARCKNDDDVDISIDVEFNYYNDQFYDKVFKDCYEES